MKPHAIVTFSESFSRLMRLTHRARAQVGSYQGIDFTGVVVIGQLMRTGPMRASDIAGCTGTDPAIITRQTHVLQELGLVDRVADPSDGRARLLTITSLGEQTFLDHAKIKENFFAKIFAEWSQSDLHKFSELFERLLTDFETQLNASATRSHKSYQHQEK